RRRIDLEPERVEGLALGIVDRARFRLGALGARASATELAHHVEWIDRNLAALEPVGRTVDAHFPGRAVAGDGILLVARDGLLAHAGEVIVRLVILAHVLEAELPILALAHPAFRRAMGSAIGAAGPIASRHLGARARLFDGLHPDPVEQWRVEFHDRT